MRAGAGAERTDGALEGVIRERVDVDIDLLSDRDVGEIRFFQVGVDPGLLGIDHAEHRGSGNHKTAELNLIDLGGNAADRGAHHGVIEVTLGLAEGRLGQRVGREIRQRQIGIAEQLGLRAGHLLLDEGEFRSRGDERGRGIVEVELRAERVLEKRRLAIDVALLEVDTLLHEVGHLVVDFDVGSQIVIGGVGLVERGLGLLFGKPERDRVDLEQHVALLDLRAFANHDLFDLAGDVGRDQHLLGADIGVVGRHIAAAPKIEHEPADQRDQRQHHQQQRAAVTPQAAHQAAARLSGNRARRTRWGDLLLGREFEDRLSHNAAPSWEVRRPDSEWRCARFP